MKIQIATAALVLGSVPAFAQATGVSNPEPVVITASDDTAAQAPAADSGRRPLTAKPQAGTRLRLLRCYGRGLWALCSL